MAPATDRLTIYYGIRWFLLCARHFVLERQGQPYRRLSATLLIATQEPFDLQIRDCAPVRVQACLVAPGVARERIVAVNSHIRIFDLPIETTYFAALAGVLGDEPLVVLDTACIAHLREPLQAVGEGGLSGPELQQLMRSVVLAVSGREPAPRKLDPRIAVAVDAINGGANLTLATLARQAGLSESRFRQLFKAELGCGLRHYLRWAAVWRAVWLWQSGRTWTEVAHACGFFDLSHLDRAFNEVFGLNPSTVVDPKRALLVRCE